LLPVKYKSLKPDPFGLPTVHLEVGSGNVGLKTPVANETYSLAC